MDVDSSKPERRFRRRGGAKKKKKNKMENVEREMTKASPVPAYQPPADGPRTFAPIFSAVPPELLSYLEKVSQSLQDLTTEQYNDDDRNASESEAALLASNAITALTPNLADLSREPTPARILQTLIKAAGPKSADAVVNALLSAGLSSLAVHICGSRVLQDAVNALEKPPQSLCDAVSTLKTDEIEHLFNDRNATHVIRAVFACLAGIPAEEPKYARLDDSLPLGSPYFRTMNLPAPSKLAVEALVAFSKTLLNPEHSTISDEPINIQSLAWSHHGSGALQVLLSALSFSDQQEIISKLVNAVVDTTETVIQLLKSSSASRLLDRIILVTRDSPIHKHLGQAENLVAAATHSIANFSAQSYLASLSERGAVANAISALEPHFQSLLSPSSPREGVILMLVRAAETIGDQAQCAKLSRAIARALGTTGPSGRDLPLALALRGLPTAQAWRKILKESNPVDWIQGSFVRTPNGTPRLNSVGVLVARSLLRMPGSAGQAVRDAIASFSPTETVALLLDGAGSRLLDGLLESMYNMDKPQQGAKAALKILTSLSPSSKNDTSNIEAGKDDLFISVCHTRCAAIVVTNCIARLSNESRKTFMNRLAENYEQLSTSPGGQSLLRKCRVQQFMKRKGDWEKEESAKETRERLFADILGDDDDNTQHRVSKSGSRKRKHEGVDNTSKKAKALKESDVHKVDEITKMTKTPRTLEVTSTSEEEERKETDSGDDVSSKKEVQKSHRNKETKKSENKAVKSTEGEEETNEGLGSVLKALENASHYKGDGKKKKKGKKKKEKKV